MPLQPIPFASQSYQDRSLSVSAQRLVNMYLEEKPAGSKSRVALHGTPGLKPWGTVGDGPCRGLLPMDDKLWVVSGAELYYVDKYGNPTLSGIVDGTDPVSMTHNGTHVVTASRTTAYYSNISGHNILSLSNINGVTTHDGYILMSVRDSQSFYITAFNDATSIDQTEFALVNALPDNIVTIENANRETWAFCERSIQIYYNSGAADFPFTRVPSGVIEIGCDSARSVAEDSGVFYWLGHDLSVYRSRGQSVERISTTPVERAIKDYSNTADSQGLVYTDEGHVFYALTFTQGTWVFDASTGLWHERVSNGRSEWRARCYARFDDKHLVGDVSTNDIYELDLDTYDEDGASINKVAVSPPIHSSGARVKMSSLVMDFEAGVGLSSGQGSEAEVVLDWSDDGGRTWSSEQWRSLGKVGEYKHRAKWTRLGQFRSRIFRVQISDPVKVTAIEALGDIEVMGA